MKSLLPVILVVLLLTGAITYALSKRVIPKREETRFGIAANELESSTIDNTKTDTSKNIGFNFVTPTPTVKPTVTPTATPTPIKLAGAKITDMPTTTEKGGDIATKVASKTVIKTTKTTICTPVYGQAETCIEHVVVDTGAEDAIFFNFAGFSYLAGLVSFVFAKRV